MFNTFQPVPVDVAMLDMRHLPADEHAALIDVHNLNLHESEDTDFDDIDNEFEELEVVSEEEFFLNYCDEAHLFD